MRAFAACLLLTSLPLLCGCGKKKAPAKAKEAAPAAAVPTLLTEGDRLGLTARVPGDVEFCLGTVNYRQHADALQSSQWWKDVKTYLEEKTPPGSGADDDVPVSDVFLAFGKDSTKSLAVLRQLNDLYNETAYRGLMSGGALAGLGTSFDIGKMVDVALTDAQVMEALILLLERFEMPPVMLGVASPEPEKVLGKISKLLRLSDWLGDAPQSRIVTTQAEQVTVNEIAMADILTVDRRKEWLETLARTMPQVTPDMRDRISRGLDVLAGKNWVLALGLSKDKGRAYVGIAQRKEQVRLATNAGDSVLARKELRFADALAQRKGLGLIACWDGGFLDVLQSNEPFHPLVRGLLAGLRSEPMFADAARRLQPLVDELGAAERSFYRNEHTTGAAVAWWEGGLRLAWEGGVNASSVPPLAAASRFTPLLDEDSVVIGVTGQGAGQGLGRAYFEAWMKLAHGTAEELIGAGVGGQQAAQTLKLVNDAILPGVLEVYGGTRTIWQKGLGGDGAFILDVGGKMPPLPGLPPGGEAVPLPRLLLAHELKDRALIASAWDGTEAALQRLLKVVPAPQPLELPAVVTRHSGALTTHAYPLPFESPDLTPCASLTNDLFMLGTSRKQQQQAAEVLAKDSPVAAGTRIKLSITRLREFLQAYAKARGDDAQGLRQTLRWLQPLEVMDAWLWADGGVARGRLTWTMHDVLRYD